MRVEAQVAAAPEALLPSAATVDASIGGVLLAFAEPVGFPLGHRLIVSLNLAEGRIHLLGHVRRVERGDDFRTYAAIELGETVAEEYGRLIESLEPSDSGNERVA